MSIGIKNIDPSANFAFSSRFDTKVSAERLFTNFLGNGKIVMLLLDLLLLNVCICVSGWVFLGKEAIFSESYLCGMVYFSLLWLFLSYLRGIHKGLLLIDTVHIFSTLAKVFFVFVVCSWFFILILLDGFNNISLFFYFICFFYSFFGGAIVFNRLLLLSIRKHFKDKIRKKKNVFIIGDSSSCELLESYIEENQCDLRLCGFFYDGFDQVEDLARYGSIKEADDGNNQVLHPSEPAQAGSYDSSMATEAYREIPEYGGEFRVFNGVGVGQDPSLKFSQTPTGFDLDTSGGKAVSGMSSLSSKSASYRLGGFIGMQSLSGAQVAFGVKSWNAIIRGRVLDCVKYFGKMPIDEIYCSMQSMEEKLARYLIKEADRHMIRIKFLPDFYQVLRRRSSIEYMGSVPVLSIRQEPLTVDSNIIIKRVFDFVFSICVIVFILSWLTPIIGLLIKLESKGPIFFKQDRAGINNKPFKVFKFRSMRKVKGVDENKQAVKYDVRLTKLGAFLRKTSLDELPQFWNVLLGNMTVVGPRPHMVSQTDKFSKEVDTYMVRHFAKPGITGWAQVNGCRGETKTREAIEQRVSHDVWYIENWSLILDLKIIFLTVWNILRGEENAY